MLGNFENILKIFDENSIDKLNFYLFLGKFVDKNRAFGNNIIFLQQFFRLGGLNPPPPTPCVRHCLILPNSAELYQISISSKSLKILKIFSRPFPQLRSLTILLSCEIFAKSHMQNAIVVSLVIRIRKFQIAYKL